jgi:hypothetical protein
VLAFAPLQKFVFKAIWVSGGAGLSADMDETMAVKAHYAHRICSSCGGSAASWSIGTGTVNTGAIPPGPSRIYFVTARRVIASYTKIILGDCLLA